MAQFMRISRGLSLQDALSAEKKEHRGRRRRLREADHSHPSDSGVTDPLDEHTTEHIELTVQESPDAAHSGNTSINSPLPRVVLQAACAAESKGRKRKHHKHHREHHSASVLDRAEALLRPPSPASHVSSSTVDYSAEPLDVNWTRLRRGTGVDSERGNLTTTTTDINMSLHRFADPEFSSLPRVISRESRALNARRHGYTRQYMQNLFHTFINWPWWRIFVLGTLLYLGTFLFFAVLYFIPLHGDQDCLINVRTFSDAFLFSLETEMTIGYGFRYPNGDCSVAIFFITCQCVVGIFVDALVLGVIYARFERPQFRQHTVRFSDKACIATRNGVPYLMIRVGNLRQSQLIETHVTLVLVHMLVTEEGERTLHLERLKLGHSEKVYLVMPQILLHPLDEQSPLHGMSIDELASLDPEIIAVLEGIEASTSDTIQAVYSYKFCDLVFGYRFARLAHVIDTHAPNGLYSRIRALWRSFRGISESSFVPETVWDLDFNRFDDLERNPIPQANLKEVPWARLTELNTPLPSPKIRTAVDHSGPVHTQPTIGDDLYDESGHDEREPSPIPAENTPLLDL